MGFGWDLTLCCQHDFSTIGAIIKTIPIDEQGLDVDYIKPIL
jgi:DNA mismatch repair protein MutH